MFGYHHLLEKMEKKDNSSFAPFAICSRKDAVNGARDSASKQKLRLEMRHDWGSTC